jgi:hypothetical protein
MTSRRPSNGGHIACRDGRSPPRRPERRSSSATLRGRSGPLAQLVEQGTLNPKVAGSIPARPIADSIRAVAAPGGHDAPVRGCTAHASRVPDRTSDEPDGGFCVNREPRLHSPPERRRAGARSGDSLHRQRRGWRQESLLPPLARGPIPGRLLHRQHRRLEKRQPRQARLLSPLATLTTRVGRRPPPRAGLRTA